MIDQTKILEILEKSGSEVAPSLDEFDLTFQAIGLDSLDVYNFLSELEVELGINISDEDFENMSTLRDVIGFINNNR